MDDLKALAAFQTRIGPANWDRLQTRLAELNQHIRTRGIVAHKEHDLLTGYGCGEFFDWDLYFENIYLSYYGVAQYCCSNLKIFLDLQLENGYTQRQVVLASQPYNHFKPFLAQTAVLGSVQLGDFDWIGARDYARLKKYLDHWVWFQDYDKNGLAVWGGAGHSGMDNQFRRLGAEGAAVIEGVDLNGYLVREFQAMAVIAQALGHSTDAAAFTAHAARLTALIHEVLWDEADGFYYDRNERTGQFVRVKSIAGFIPLWLGRVPPPRAQRLVYDHLHNPDEFWLRYPVATWAKTEPDYYQEPQGEECNWRGPAWIPTNYMLFHGLRRQGFTPLAEELAYRTFEMALKNVTTREYYNSETGAGLGRFPFWGWSSLAYGMPLEFEAGYDPTDLTAVQVRPLFTNLLGLAWQV